MASRLCIVGAGGHGKVCAECAELMNRWNEIVFIDQSFPEVKICGAWAVVSDNLEDALSESSDVFVAIGDNNTRRSIFQKLSKLGAHFVTLIHPSAVVSKRAKVGKGVLIAPRAVVNIGCDIADCVIINTGAIVEHDCKLDEAVHVSPGVKLAGEVHVGELTWLGIGTSIKQQVDIAPRIVIGAGAVIVANLLEPGTYMGVPAKKIN